VLPLRKILFDECRLLLIRRTVKEGLSIDGTSLLGLLLFYLVGDHMLTGKSFMNFVCRAILGGRVSAAMDTERTCLLKFIVGLISETVFPILALPYFVLGREPRHFLLRNALVSGI
jgi:hypothetical protein